MSGADPDAGALSALTPAERHRRVADRFGEVVGVIDATDGWDAPTPVPEWRARDIIDHLVTWTRAFLIDAGVPLGPPPAAGAGPSAVWASHAAVIQALLDDPIVAARDVTHPQVGTESVSMTVDLFVTADVYLHTWDLAQAAGVDPGLDAAHAADMLEGMTLMDDLLRASGHYGPAVPVADDADPVTALMAFLGHDPGWRARDDVAGFGVFDPLGARSFIGETEKNWRGTGRGVFEPNDEPLTDPRRGRTTPGDVSG